MSHEIEPDVGDRTPWRLSHTTLIATVVVLAVAAMAAAFFAGAMLGPDQASDASTPGTASVDAGFARDMQQHHAQAVETSNLVLESSRDEQVRTIARDIMLTQQQQIGQMYGWLDLWGLDQSSSEPAMAWMGSDGMEGHDMDADAPESMPGMATPEQIAYLDSLEGPEADRYYLQLMIPHHEGALAMAEAAAADAQTPQVRDLAATIVASQTSELVALRQMLEERGGPIPDVTTGGAGG